MKELILYVEALKEIICMRYEKQMAFYGEGEWYSREHGRVITSEELVNWVLEIVYSNNKELEELREYKFMYEELCK